MKKIGFICTGNSCRSPMAECYFQFLVNGKEEIDVFSAGIASAYGWKASSEAVEIMKRFDLDLSRHRSSPLTDEMVDSSDMLIVMTISHKRNILDRWPHASRKIYLLREFEENFDVKDQDIMDPVGFPIEVYEKCFELMKKPLERLGDIVCKKQ